MYQPNDLPHYEIITVDCWVVLPHISVIPYLTTNAHGQTLRSNTLKRGILSTPKGEKWSYYADWDYFWLPWNSWNLPFRSVKQGLLVEDGINGNRCLTGLSIANDQFPLSTADGNQTVHCFQTSGPHSVSVAAFRGDYMRFAWKKNVRKGYKGMGLTQIVKFEWWCKKMQKFIQASHCFSTKYILELDDQHTRSFCILVPGSGRWRVRFFQLQCWW